MAPKKANWDLKREVQPKLDKLERRTLRALVEIMQQVGVVLAHAASCGTGGIASLKRGLG